MSTLQISLLVIGALVVLAVYVFNVVQERRVRRRIESERAAQGAGSSPTTARKASKSHPAAKSHETRREPTLREESATPPGAGRDGVVERPLGPGHDAIADQPPGVARDAVAGRPPEPARTAGAAPAEAPRTAVDVQPDSETEFVALFRLQQPLARSEFHIDDRAKFGKAVRWFGRRASQDAWVPLADGIPPELNELAACLMLVDRDGPLSTAQLQTFLHMVDDLAGSLPAAVEAPDAAAALERAKVLDRICADVDVQIGITLVKGEGGGGPGTIAGTRLRGVVEAAGFRLNRRGQFDYHGEESDAPLFSLQNLANEPFTADSLRSLQTPGVTLLLDVPRTGDPVRSFDQMRAVAKRLATTLEAQVVDDNRKPLTDAALGAIRTQVQQTAAAMRADNIEPGSARANRLFN
jgi:hypothetical protein